MRYSNWLTTYLSLLAVGLASIAANPICSVFGQLLQNESSDSASNTESSSDSDEKQLDWSKIPRTLRPMPRPGFFPVPPKSEPFFRPMLEKMRDEINGRKTRTGYSNLALMQYSFFDADWRYVDKIDPQQRNHVERLKRIRLGEQSMISFGGSYWIRYMNENNSRLTSTTNDYTLQRLRLYGDWYYNDSIRVFGEFLWADSLNPDLKPLVTDIDRGDFLNLFVDLKLFEFEDKPVFVRGGRQEMLYGSQRLLSPLEWANTRRTFEGVKVFRQGDHWDFDAFWVQPVIPRANEFDQADHNQNLYGSWATYRREKGEFIDLYYLGYNNGNQLTEKGIERGPLQVHTFGSRVAGDESGWLWDFEAMTQVGEQAGQDLVAGAATVGLGRTWTGTGSPTVWAYYDYASGDSDPTSGTSHTFNQLFPFGHYYMGWMDLVGRQNIHDLNLHFYFYPSESLTLWLQYHRFWLDQARDGMYGPSGNIIRRDPTGEAGNDLGNEIGIFANLHLTHYSDVMASYNKLYGGRFLKSTSGPNQSSDADSLYLMFNKRW